MSYLSLAYLFLSLQAGLPTPGVLQESVACQANPGQSYAAYLPSNFSLNKTWPVILCFEPAARGPIPVNLFMEAAENYGYLVFASNNSRNYNEQLIADSVNALWTEVMNRYPVDSNRIYAAGMSGGARIATRLADQTGKIAGVIACAAGYSIECSPSKGDPYVFAGIMGDLDFNYSEFKNLEDSLFEADIPFHMFYFEGTHGWPPREYCNRALEWLELQAMKKKLQPANSSWLETLYSQEMSSVQESRQDGQEFLAFRMLTQIVRDFDGLHDIQNAKILLAQLEQSKSVEKAVKNEKKQLQHEEQIQAPFFKRLKYIGYSGFDVFQGKENLNWFSREYPKLHKRTENETDPMAKKMYQRVESSLLTYCLEMMIVSLNQNELDQAEMYYQFSDLMKPDTVSMTYNLACLRARQGKLEEAVTALEKAVRLGYKNRAGIENDSDLDAIKSLEGYKKIIMSLQGN